MTVPQRLIEALFVVALSLAIFGFGWAMRGDLADATPDDAGFPVFNCQEDELMVWKDARHTSECVNVEEYEHDLHVEAGHIDG